MRVIPISLKQANEFVEKYHRHHNPVVGHKFSIGALGDKHLKDISEPTGVNLFDCLDKSDDGA